MHVGQRIKKARKKAGLTQQSLADKIGVSRTSVLQWERGEVKDIKAQYLVRVANATGSSMKYLAVGDDQHFVGEPHAPYGQEVESDKIEVQSIHQNQSITNTEVSQASDSAKILGGLDVWDSDTPIDEDEVELRFFKDVEASAGNGTQVSEFDKGYKLRFSRRTLSRLNVSPENAVCITVSGNSMEPQLPDGSTVGVDTGDTVIRDGKVYAVITEGLLRVKVLYSLPGGGMRMRSYNSNEHPDDTFSAEQVREKNIRVLGRVFWASILY